MFKPAWLFSAVDSVVLEKHLGRKKKLKTVPGKGRRKPFCKEKCLVVTSQDAGARLPGFESWLHYF